MKVKSYCRKHKWHTKKLGDCYVDPRTPSYKTFLKIIFIVAILYREKQQLALFLQTSAVKESVFKMLNHLSL